MSEEIIEVLQKVYKGELPKEALPEPVLLEDLGYLYPNEDSKQKRRYGIYKCGFCGEEFRTQMVRVKSGETKSCGCYRKRRYSEYCKTHGLTNTKLYYIWNSMKGRTLSPNSRDYYKYGNRGIGICEEWKNDFKAFYDWAMSNGYEEDKGLSIDRIDNDEGYEPNNCRWTTRTIQSRNRRIQKNNTSGYKGVSYFKKSGSYEAYININKKRIRLGYYKTAEEGAIAYNTYIIENNLEGFILNEIPEECLNKNKEDRN